MDQKQYDYYTRIVINDVAPRYKRSVKIKDELIPHEVKHYKGTGQYKRIQCRYSTKTKQARIVFLGYNVNEVWDAILSRKHPDFTTNIEESKIVREESGMIGLNRLIYDDTIYQYKLKKYVPFSSDAYKIFDNMRKRYYDDSRVSTIKQPILIHHLQSHIYLHLKYMMQSLSSYISTDISQLKVNVTGPVQHTVQQFKSGESCFDLTFTSNIWLPEDLNIGNHVAYGFGQLAQGEKWDLRT